MGVPGSGFGATDARAGIPRWGLRAADPAGGSPVEDSWLHIPPCLGIPDRGFMAANPRVGIPS